MNDLIGLLNSLGYNIVCIGEEIYVYTVFEPFTSYTNRSVVKGREISSIINSVSSNTVLDSKSQKDQIISKIESFPIVKREYSPQFKFITYLSF